MITARSIDLHILVDAIHPQGFVAHFDRHLSHRLAVLLEHVLDVVRDLVGAGRAAAPGVVVRGWRSGGPKPDVGRGRTRHKASSRFGFKGPGGGVNYSDVTLMSGGQYHAYTPGAHGLWPGGMRLALSQQRLAWSNRPGMAYVMLLYDSHRLALLLLRRLMLLLQVKHTLSPASSGVIRPRMLPLLDQVDLLTAAATGTLDLELLRLLRPRGIRDDSGWLRNVLVWHHDILLLLLWLALLMRVLLLMILLILRPLLLLGVHLLLRSMMLDNDMLLLLRLLVIVLLLLLLLLLGWRVVLRCLLLDLNYPVLRLLVLLLLPWSLKLLVDDLFLLRGRRGRLLVRLHILSLGLILGSAVLVIVLLVPHFASCFFDTSQSMDPHGSLAVIFFYRDSRSENQQTTMRKFMETFERDGLDGTLSVRPPAQERRTTAAESAFLSLGTVQEKMRNCQKMSKISAFLTGMTMGNQRSPKP